MASLVADDKLPITSRGGVFGIEAEAADLFSRMIFARSSLDKLDVDVVTLAFDDATPLRALTLFVRGMSSLE